MKPIQLDQMDYMGCQQQRTTNIDVPKVASLMSEHYNRLKVSKLESYEPVVQVRVIQIKVS
ncbi:MAG: hypothetical protein MK212_03955 [Saprospiraceae bacterium]|nr:hypothetical protein [Saprospiraceae bacterium]